MNELAIEQLTADDVGRNVALSRSVGWKDVDGEWRVLHEGATVLGVRQGERLLAQGALGDDGSAAALAKMVVAPDAQRQGIGARLLDRLLAAADARGVPVGLAATEQGRPLYASRGFQVTGELGILFGTPNPGTTPGGDVVSLTDVVPVLDVNRRCLGCDRSRMLRGRFREASAAFAAPGAGGYALATPQGEMALVGPILAESEALACQLAAQVFRALPGPLRIDVPVEQAGFRRWLAALGLREQAVRVEMARGTQRLPWQVAQRYALATQAWG